jgi:uncharacterized protein YgiM (DUF1202 family)
MARHPCEKPDDRLICSPPLLEAKSVRSQADTYYVKGARVNLRIGPTTNDRVLSRETPVFAEHSEADWMLVRVISGSAGWIHKNLVRR